MNEPKNRQNMTLIRIALSTFLKKISKAQNLQVNSGGQRMLTLAKSLTQLSKDPLISPQICYSSKNN